MRTDRGGYPEQAAAADLGERAVGSESQLLIRLAGILKISSDRQHAVRP